MTRINCVPVSELTGKHLVAEWKEAFRVVQQTRRCMARGERPEDMPESYRLGKGHVRFFASRLAYVFLRQMDLRKEMLRRGYQCNWSTFELARTYVGIPHEWWGHWQPDDEALALNRARIAQRLQEASNAA